MTTGKFWTIIGLVLLGLFLGAIDLGLNVIGIFIPALGAVIETISELIIEALQGLVVILLGVLGLMKNE